MSEEMVTDPKTGGVKGRKDARFELLPGDALAAVAVHFAKGSRKYEDRNWERGYGWSLSFGAMQRHLWAWWQGEDIDEESGTSHAVSAAWHALALVAFELRDAGTDDRPGAKPKRKRRKDAGVPRLAEGIADMAAFVNVSASEVDAITEHLRATGQVGVPDRLACNYPDCDCRHPETGCEGQV